MDNYLEPQSLWEIKDELKEMLADGVDPYIVALYGITLRYTFTSSDRPDDGFMTFLEEQLVKTDNIAIAFLKNEESAALIDYMRILSMYYIISEDYRNYRKIVNWLPGLTAKQKQVVLTWPEQMIFSVFNVRKENDSIHFQDLKDDHTYLVEIIEPEAVNEIERFNFSVMTMLLPTETNYLSAPPILCQTDTEIESAFKSAKSKKESEIALLNWYNNWLSEADRFHIDQLEDPFYPAAREEKESTRLFAKRLLSQDEELLHFEHYAQLEALMIKVIDTFPQMFFPDSNAHSLLDAMRKLFTKGSEQDEFLDLDYLPDFWYLLIREHLPKEVKKIENWQVSEDYWYDEDGFDYDFDFDD